VITAVTVTAGPVGFFIAFGAGIVSFLSPCVLPLVPGYLSMVTGLSAAELGAGRSEERPLRPLLQGIGLFVAGFTIVFVALGAAASGLGHLLGTHKRELSVLAGALVVGLGAVLLVTALPTGFWRRVGPRFSGRIGALTSERRLQVRPATLGAWAAPVMGMAFAFAWTPCIGPVLGAVTALAATRSTLGGGVLLLFAYSLGLGVPFVITGLAFGRLTALYGRMSRAMWVLQVIGGVILVVFGVLLLTDQLSWLATQMQHLMRHIGLGRFTTS
jgi:cytochrome c-type biogenesis protein